MPTPLLDVTRLVERALRRKLPTGVDRVALAYVAHYRDRSRALVRFAGRWVVLARGDSRRLFDALLEPTDGFARRVVWWVGRAFVLSWGLPRGSVLGTLAVIDTKPGRLTAAQVDALATLAKQIVSELELRTAYRDLTALRAREREFETRDKHISSLEAKLIKSEADLATANDVIKGQRVEIVQALSLQKTLLMQYQVN